MDSNALLMPFGFLGLYMLLEAADWGIGLAAPFLAHSKEEKEAAMGLWKPGLDGNELWLVLGLMLLWAGMPATAGSMPTLLLAGFAGLGALLRLVAVFVRNPFLLKGMQGISLLSLVLMGLSLSSFMTGSLLSVTGIVLAIWMLIAFFQIGCLYGAVKVVNPLGEKFRASSLVSAVLGLIVYVVLALLLYVNTGDLYQYGLFFWTSMGGAILLSLVAFILTRMRHAPIGLAFAFISLGCALATVLSSVSSVLFVHMGATGGTVAQEPSTILLGVAAVWSLAALGWKLFRQKEYVPGDSL